MHTSTGILLNVNKKNKTVPFAATWMQPELIILSESMRKTILYVITFMWNLKYDANEPKKQKQTHG